MSVRRPWLLPLVPLYAGGLLWKQRGFASHPERARRLAFPVVSVGSVSAGGAGKTPFLMALAGLVRELGYQPDVLSRGYGRRSKAVCRVDPHGAAIDFGDEPLMLARMLGCPVYVGAERFEAGLLAESERPDAGCVMHLLDDGFGHRRLARAVDIALLTEEDARDTLLPAGNLREPLSALRRADIVVVRATEADRLRPVLEWLALGEKPVWTIERHLTLPQAMPARPFVFCGLARPGDFEASLLRQGVVCAGVRRYRDHHRYTAADVETLCRRARAADADGFLTTRKDDVKLDEAMRARLKEVGPLAVADALVTLQDRARCGEDLRELLRSRTQQGSR